MTMKRETTNITGVWRKREEEQARAYIRKQNHELTAIKRRELRPIFGVFFPLIFLLALFVCSLRSSHNTRTHAHAQEFTHLHIHTHAHASINLSLTTLSSIRSIRALFDRFSTQLE